MSLTPPGPQPPTGPGERPAHGRWPTAATVVVGVIGDPVAHSLSPLLHNTAFASMGLDWVSLAFPVAAGKAPEALVGMRALGIAGLSVTMPHKSAVAGLVDRLTPEAARLGAVNCVAAHDGLLVGDSTDGAGLLASLRREQGFEPAGRRCLVIGAGGAARAVVAALAGGGAAEVVVVNRTAGRSGEAAALAGPVGRVGSPGDAAAMDLVVNATPAGMAGTAAEGAAPAVDPTGLGPGQLVVDLIYHPLRTAWLEAAAERGATTVGGLGMLVHQAAAQLARWTGAEPPVAAMWEAARAAVADRS